MVVVGGCGDGLEGPLLLGPAGLLLGGDGAELVGGEVAGVGGAEGELVGAVDDAGGDEDVVDVGGLEALEGGWVERGGDEGGDGGEGRGLDGQGTRPALLRPPGRRPDADDVEWALDVRLAGRVQPALGGLGVLVWLVLVSAALPVFLLLLLVALELMEAVSWWFD